MWLLLRDSPSPVLIDKKERKIFQTQQFQTGQQSMKIPEDLESVFLFSVHLTMIQSASVQVVPSPEACRSPGAGMLAGPFSFGTTYIGSSSPGPS